MEFEWDEAKRLRVLEKHGLDFRRARDVIEGDHLAFPARSDVEPRVWAVGPLDGVLVAVCFTMRGARCRLVTMRRARTDERGAYLSRHDRGDPEAQG